MNNIAFTYSLLRYVHSQTLGEIFNVGILFSFPEQRKVVFKYPKTLSRLKGLYKNFSESQIRAYLNGFHQKALDLSVYRDDTKLFQKEVSNTVPQDFLIDDATALQFSEPALGFLNGKDINYVVNQYYRLYFSDYAGEKENVHRHDEAYIIKIFQESLKSKSRVAYHRFKKDVIVESNDTSLKFDLSWQNGSTNLIKTVSFDLSNNDNINDKSVLLYGKLNLLVEKAEQENLRYDLLVSKPQDKNLFRAFDKALNILESSEAPKKIITEDQYSSYVENAVESYH